MTSLPVHTACQYLTAGGEWRESDYRALAIIKSVKGEACNVVRDFKIGGVSTRLSKYNMDKGLELAGSVLADRLITLTKSQVTVVPIPNSHAHIGAPPAFRTLLLAEFIAKFSNGLAEASPALLWDAPKEKQHQGAGYRSANQFYRNLRIARPIERPVVLIDDVITSGSQMLAATYVLRKAGAEVPFGMAVGRTTKVQTPQSLEWCKDTLTELIL